MKHSTERDYHRRIARVIETILRDPAAPHTVDSLASVAHLSPFHFHRIYRALTGESIAATVQRLRLAQAAHRLTDTSDSVTNIALDVGYDSPQAFARAFRGFAGVSPSAFQMRQRHLAISAEEGGVKARQEGASAVDLPMVVLTEMPPIDVLCLRHEGPIATIPQTFRTLVRTLCLDHGSPAIEGMIGICSGDPEECGQFRYLAGLIATTPIEAAGAVEAVRLEGGLYGAHRFVGPYALIAPTFRALFGGWLPQSGYEPDDRPALELYCKHGSSGHQNDRVTDLLIPIRKD
ncbi:GyrI-like domain-containing protein [Telmatospirillum sp.]|uniref:AraC family transcriptional regulator n=1 Tax=Telmatospirillum sp. TaxID=2079197 RepID=UPI002846671C|nr:GyrI-like domain-containing protein [Telmatospirillum sp.]MDR3436050.1 GyrI-like domain-containing protein [Telmatospirillum sp.]